MASLPDEPQIPSSNHVTLYNISWDFYESLLEQIGDEHVLVTYDRGSMEIASPLPEREWWKKIIGGLINVLTMELNIPMASLGSTTFRRRDLQCGLEPDECYYIQHVAAVRGKRSYDLRLDPPPDLVVEVDISCRDVDRMAIYASLGVPEVWRFDGRKLEAMQLSSEGRYEQAEHSVAFPFLKVSELARFLAAAPEGERTAMMRGFRDWVRQSFPTRD